MASSRVAISPTPLVYPTEVVPHVPRETYSGGSQAGVGVGPGVGVGAGPGAGVGVGPGVGVGIGVSGAGVQALVKGSARAKTNTRQKPTTIVDNLFDFT